MYKTTCAIHVQEREKLLQEMNKESRVAVQSEIQAAKERRRAMQKQKELEEKARKYEKTREHLEAEAKKARLAKERHQKREKLEKNLSDIDGALKHLEQNYSVDRVRLTTSLIGRVLRNIIKHPQEPKYRTLRLDNERVQKALVRPLGGMLIMQHLGFEMGEEGRVLTFRGDAARLQGMLGKFEQEEKKTGKTELLIPHGFFSR